MDTSKADVTPWTGMHTGGFYKPDLQGVYVTTSYIQIA